MSSDRRATMSYRPDIDGLRAIAILLVVFFHGGFREASGGFVGVDIFFVISGFLITGIVLRELDAGDFSFVHFYARRIKRIIPALFITLVLSATAGLFLLVPQDLQSLGQSISSAVFFYANWHFYTQVGYFDGPAVEKPLLHTWSLAVEEQFYLICPAAFWALYRIAGKKALLHIVLGLLCLSLVASQVELQTDPASVFYLLPYRAWELLLGGYIAMVPALMPSRRAASALGALGLSAIAYAALAFDTKTPFPGLHALAPCAGAAFLILAGRRENVLSSLVLGAKPLRFVGKVSYSLYLIHWPIFSFTRMALDRDITQVECLAIIAVSFGAAVLSWRFIESPARKIHLSFPALAGISAAATMTLGLCMILYHVTHGLPFRVSKSVLEADAAREAGQKKNTECRGGSVLAGLSCAIGAPPQDAQFDFLIWGDSHARHLAGAFSDQAIQRGLAGVIMSSGACGPFLHDSRMTPRCIKANEQIEQWIKTQSKLKSVFLASYWSKYVNNGLLTASDNDGVARNEPPRTGLTGLADTLRLLRSLPVQIVIVEDVPAFPHNVSLCAARARMFSRPDAHCLTLAKSELERSERETSAVLRQISHRFIIPLINTAQAFCEGDVCRAEKAGVIFYRDKDHLNKAGSHYLGLKLQIPWQNLNLRTGGLTESRVQKLSN